MSACMEYKDSGLVVSTCSITIWGDTFIPSILHKFPILSVTRSDPNHPRITDATPRLIPPTIKHGWKPLAASFSAGLQGFHITLHRAYVAEPPWQDGSYRVSDAGARGDPNVFACIPRRHHCWWNQRHLVIRFRGRRPLWSKQATRMAGPGLAVLGGQRPPADRSSPGQTEGKGDRFTAGCDGYKCAPFALVAVPRLLRSRGANRSAWESIRGGKSSFVLWPFLNIPEQVCPQLGFKATLSTGS